MNTPREVHEMRKAASAKGQALRLTEINGMSTHTPQLIEGSVLFPSGDVTLTVWINGGMVDITVDDSATLAVVTG